MTGQCGSCEHPADVFEPGLCGPCRSELRFIVRPEAHREMERRRQASRLAARAVLQHFGVNLIDAYPRDNAHWICDICNSRIPITTEHTLIPLIGSYALCIPCAHQLPYWPEGWTRPTPRACRCGACQRPLLTVIART